MKNKNREPKKTKAVITTNKVVARFLDGTAIKGWCHAFHQEKPSFKIESVDRSATDEIALEDLKALFFVREFEGLEKGLGNAVLPQASPVSTLGQHVQVEFLDGEVIQGYAEALKKERQGFFITPLDTENNNLRIFVPYGSLRTLRVAPKLGETMVREGIVHQNDMATALRKQKEFRETKIGEVLVASGLSSPEDVERALNIQRMVSRKIGSILVQADILSEQDLEKALVVQRENRSKRLGEILVNLGLATPESVSLALALKYRLPYVDPSIYPIDPMALALVSEETAKGLKFIPILKKEDELTIAIDDPINFGPRDHIQSTTGLKVREVISTPQAIREAIVRHYGASVPRSPTRHPAAIESMGERIGDDEFLGLTPDGDKDAVAKLLDGIFRAAVEKQASDIHINPDRQATSVSYRLEGVLHRERNIDSRIHPTLVSRIKILGNMSTAERDLPQEGRARLHIGERLFDLKMSSLPTIWGESLVIRLFEKSGPVMKLEDIGFFPEDLYTIRNLLTRSHGLLLVTGPAGSGRSTTLYSLLREPVFKGKNLIAIEEKPEYELSNTTQIQIKPHIDLTYAKALRQSLKHDPDVIVVGEIRDPETWRIAVHAALSGHLILATLNAPTASETLSRLVDMGIEPYLISSSLLGIISQRLVKTICTCADCRIEDTGAIESLTAAGVRPEHYQGITFSKGVGCEACRNGYKGRTIIYEVMVIDTPIKRGIVEGRSIEELHTLAKENGMHTMTETAFLKAKAGITTAEQIISLSLRDMR